MGLNPLMPAWVVLGVGDAILAHLVPSLAAGAHHQGTAVGGLLNFALSMALLAVPSRGGDAGSAPPAPRMTRVESLGSSIGGSAVAAAPPVARMAAIGAPRKEFGRRNLR